MSVSPWKKTSENDFVFLIMETTMDDFFHLKINLQIPLTKNPVILTFDARTLKKRNMTHCQINLGVQNVVPSTSLCISDCCLQVMALCLTENVRRITFIRQM